MVQALKEDGEILILTYPKESPYYLFLEETMKRKHWQQYWELSVYRFILNSDEYYDTLVDAGMKIDEFHVEENIATYETKEDLISYVRGWLLCYAKLPGNLHEAFLNEAANNAKGFSIDNGDNKLHIPYKMLKIRASK